MTRPPALLVAVLILGGAEHASAHEVETDRLWLRADLARGELRGQITLNPHYTREDPSPGSSVALPPSAAADVIEMLDRALTLEVDGKPCQAELKIRELWSPGAPSPGDLVTLRCPLPPTAMRFSVAVGFPIDPLIVAVEGVPREHQPVLIRAGSSTAEYSLGRTEPAPPSRGKQAWRYLVLGVEHIVPHGLDHVLFVVGLVLGAASRVRALLLQLSAFTVAHTLTLALATLGWIRVPPTVVEPLIALSIALLALDNLRRRRSLPGRTSVIFGFGLLHGLGFAGALSETGLSGGSLVVSLLAFNVGVELGQLLVVSAVLAALALVRHERDLREHAVRLSSLAIAGVALWWAVQRVLA